MKVKCFAIENAVSRIWTALIESEWCKSTPTVMDDTYLFQGLFKVNFRRSNLLVESSVLHMGSRCLFGFFFKQEEYH